MNNKILVIFLFAIIFSIIIFSSTNNHTKRITFIGENSLIDSNLLNKYINYNVKSFTYDNITYEELIKKIKNNDYYIEKNKKIYLNKLINNSDYVLIFANNIEYNKKCDKNKVYIKKYENKINKNLEQLINLIKRISDNQIILIQNYCINYDVNNNYTDQKIISIKYDNNDHLILQIQEVLEK